MVFLGWLMFARSGEENISSSGFSDGGAGVAASPFSSARSSAFARRSVAVSSLSSATLPSGSLSSVRLEAVPGPAAGADQAGAAPAAGAAAPAKESDEPDAKALAALGVPTDKAGLSRLANQHGLLSRLTNAVLGHPKVVKFLLNNQTIVDGLFSREAGKRNCESGSALTSYLMNGNDPKGVSEDTPILKALMRHPDSAAEAVNSEFGRRVMACPSVAQMKTNPAGMAQAVMANPSLLSIVTDPGAVSAVSANPEAAALFSAAQSAIGSGAGSAP